MYNIFNKDKFIVQFLINNAFFAIKSSRRNIIFEPFPTRFLKKDANIKRGELSALKGKSYDDLKDFNKLESSGVQLIKVLLIKEPPLIKRILDI